MSVRAGLTVAAAKGHVEGALARCLARVFIETQGVEALVFAVGNGTPSSEQGARLRAVAAASGAACRADPDSGLR